MTTTKQRFSVGGTEHAVFVVSHIDGSFELFGRLHWIQHFNGACSLGNLEMDLYAMVLELWAGQARCEGRRAVTFDATGKGKAGVGDDPCRAAVVVVEVPGGWCPAGQLWRQDGVWSSAGARPTLHVMADHPIWPQCSI